MSAVSPLGHYEDIHYACIHCSAPSTFTTEAQKDAFESRKAYLWQRRVLCENCFGVRRASECELRAIRSRWRGSRADVRRDPAALQRWLDLLLSLPAYGARRDVAAIAMVTRSMNQDVMPPSPTWQRHPGGT